MVSRRVAIAGPLVLLLCVSVGFAAPARADVAAALRALDSGDDATARTGLALEIARLSYYQALAERGDARKAAAERAAAAAPEGSWIRDASAALIASADDKGAEAIAALERATAGQPDEARLWKQMGDAKQAAGDRTGARAAYSRATQIDPGFTTALLGLGDSLRTDGDFQGAYNAYNHAASEAPDSVSALVGRASARLYFGDKDGASADLDRAVAIAKPGNDRYRALMGVVYFHTFERDLPAGLDRAEQAAQMWNELGRPDMVAATLNAAARVQLETGDAAGAEAWYDRAWQGVQASTMKLEERTIWQVRWLHGKARCASAQRENERANGHAAEAHQLMAADKNPANQEQYGWIGPYLDGYLALNQRRYDDAIAALQQSDLERAHIRALLADAYARNRDRDNARVWYQRALEAANGLDSESVIVRPVAAAWLAKNR